MKKMILITGLLALSFTIIQAEEVKPGKEGSYTIPGHENYPCRIYVPSDYKKGTPFPVILFMHGAGGRATTWPFKEATKGKGYIIIGLSYAPLPGGGSRGISGSPAASKAMAVFFKKVIAHTKKLYGINENHAILSGLSMGGWGVCYYGFCPDSKGLFHSYIIIAAGPVKGRGSAVDFSVAKGIPVLILNGKNDPNLRAANQGKPELEKAGAIVEQVVIPDEGHVPRSGTMDKPLSGFLTKYSHTREIMQIFEKGEAAETENRIGDAITIYKQGLVKAAQKKVILPDIARIEKHIKELITNGKKELDEAGKLKDQSQFKKALASLKKIKERYKGHEISHKADSEIKLIQRREEDTRAALKVLTQAQKEIKKEEFVKGVKLLRKILDKYPSTPSADTARKKLKNLKNNPAALKALKAAIQEAKCRQYINMARNFIKSGIPESAIEYLDKVIKQYPDTKWAEEAKKMKEEMK